MRSIPASGKSGDGAARIDPQVPRLGAGGTVTDLRVAARATPAALATPPVAPGEPAIAPIVSAGNPGPDRDPALSALSDQHFERSKLVVLGIATKDARQADWAYERQLAGTLLSDTRLYRVAAEERGMQSLAGVMRDLELVLLQTSMSEQRDTASLEHLQRLIRRRDLITKMEVVHASAR